MNSSPSLESFFATESPDALLNLTEAQLSKRKQSAALASYRPYRKQAIFHALGLTCVERLLRAGNQQGKTFAGGMELAMHLTGRYPPQWMGRRWTRPVDTWAACDTGETTRDNPQRVLLGPVRQWGTGTIPADDIEETLRGRGTGDLIDTVLVRHQSGGLSRLSFKRYDQGRSAWQGPPKDVIWCDEEPPEDVYGEALARLIATGGMIFTTFTPLLGMSNVVKRLMGSPGDVNMVIDDAEHIPIAERARIVASFAEHERDARAMGIPVLGGGRVFPIGEGTIRVQDFDIPPHFAQLGAMDFGYDHPFAAVKLAWDRDNDVIYVTREYRIREQTPVVHAAAMKHFGPPQLRWSWPHDGHQHDKGSGETLAAQYRAQKLNVRHTHATHKDGGFGLEAGVSEMLDRMKTGRWKVFASCGLWFEEFRLYHRKDGLIVKEGDDLLSASRQGMMDIRHARPFEDVDNAPHTAFGAYDPLEGTPDPRDVALTQRMGSAGAAYRTREETDYDPFNPHQ